MTHEIRNPFPGNHDEEVQNGTVKAKWEAPFNGTEDATYNIYFGTDPRFMEEHYLGSEETTATFKELWTGKTYYWRVDTESPEGEAFSGRTLNFTPA